MHKICFILSFLLAVTGFAKDGFESGPAVKADLFREVRETKEYLPTAFAEAVFNRQLSLVFHDNPESLVADYVETEAGPVLLLYEAHFLEDGKLIPFAEQTLDVLSSLFEALFNAYASQFWVSNEHIKRILTSRAQKIYDSVPEDQKLVVYIDAMAQLVGHAVGIAFSVEKAHRRIGDLLCQRFETPLFKRWDSVFKTHSYRGGYHITHPDGRGEWKDAEENLPVVARKWLLEKALSNYWVGETQSDFASKYCQ